MRSTVTLTANANAARIEAMPLPFIRRFLPLLLCAVDWLTDHRTSEEIEGASVWMRK